MLERFNQIFITGVNGWLGQNFLAYLRAISDLPITGLDKEIKGDIDKNGYNFISLDIRNKVGLEAAMKNGGGSLLFHLAGVIHPQKVSDFFEINYEGTKKVIETAIENGFRRAIIMSSNSPVGINPHNDHRFDEDSPFNPYFGYGRSKMLMEKYISTVRNKIETVVIRAPWFYGPNQPRRQTDFFSMIKNGKGPIVGSGENFRSMTYVDNLSQGLVLAAHKPIASGQTYWIADEEPYTMSSIINTIEDLLQNEFGFKISGGRLRLPNFASHVAELADFTLQSMGLYNKKVHVLSEMNKTIVCSIEKAKRELNYIPSIALREGMRRSIKWCVENEHTI